MNGLSKWDPLKLKDWDPFRDLDDFQHRLGSFFGNLPARFSREGAEWSPSVDIIEDNKEFVVKAELPEVKKEDVHVTVEGGMLTIRGERKSEKEEKGKRFHRTERSYGTFIRSFSLPDGADPGQVRAQFKDGMLYVHLPKSEKARPREVEVKVE